MKALEIKYGLAILLTTASLAGSAACGCSRPLELGLGEPDSSDDGGSTDTRGDTDTATENDTETDTGTSDDGGPDPDSGVTD